MVNSINRNHQIAFGSKITFKDKKDFFEFESYKDIEQVDKYIKEALTDKRNIKLKVLKPTLKKPLSAEVTQDKGFIENIFQKVFSRNKKVIVDINRSEHPLLADAFRALVRKGAAKLWRL